MAYDVADEDNLITLRLCIDCAMAATNDVWPEPGHTPWPLSEITPGWSLTAGSIHSAEQLIEDQRWGECIHDGIDFDPRPCHGCGSSLAGARLKYTMWPPKTVIV